MAHSGWLFLCFLFVYHGRAAFWRLPCRSRSGTGRLDPLASPGVPSKHVHAIFGGNNFGYNTSYEDLRKSTCTSCSVVQDKSAYWVPPLYFTADNQTFTMVPQKGGLVVYYFMNKPSSNTSLTFPPGFRMLSGDTDRRNISIPLPDPPKSFWTTADQTQDALRQKAIGFNCLGSIPPEGSLQRHSMPPKDFLAEHCPGGLRLELMFPSCWNGRNTDSHDHRSHVAYPSLVQDGMCPDKFPSRIPALLYEVSWETSTFKNTPGRFILGNGDYTGLGYHGDFISGWDHTLLKAAGETCSDPGGEVEKCSIFTLKDEICEFAMPSKLQDEDYDGPRQGLPGIGQQ